MLVFWFWWEIVFGVTYVLSVQYSCAVVSVSWLWGEKISKWEHLLNSYWVTLLWSASRSVYFIRPNTLLLCIFLFCTFLLYHTDPQVKVHIRILLKDKYVKSCQNANTDPQVEVHIRILLKDKYVKLCQNANTGNHTLIPWTMLIGFLYFRETTC